MKHVVSVSLGSARRDHAVETEILGERFRIERIGTDGSMEKAIELIRDLDGKIDAFGMGGIDLFIVAGKRRYILKDAKRIAAAAQKTPMVDGSGLKNTLERKAVDHLVKLGYIKPSQKVLLVCAADRFGMAEALVAHKVKVTFGDLAFGLKIPVAIHSLRALEIIVNILGPIISLMPFEMLYPIGDQQDKVISGKYSKYYNDNEIIAGDFHYIKRYLPGEIAGKTILTNTVTAEDVELLRQRGAQRLITTTPEFNGRSFGTNVMEAVLVSLLGRSTGEVSEHEYNELLERLQFTPRIIEF